MSVKYNKGEKKKTNTKNVFEGNLKIIKDSIKKYNKLGKKYNVKITYIEGNYNLSCNNCKHNSIESVGFLYNRLKVLEETPCVKCIPRNNKQTSKIERYFGELVNELYDGTIIYSNRTILNGKEIDILLPDINIGIEINGLYWHSDIYKKNKYYHYDKMIFAEEKNIKLYQFLEDEIKQSMGIIYNIILDKKKLKKNININNINKKYGLNLYKNKIKLDIKYTKKLDLITYRDILSEYITDFKFQNNVYGGISKNGILGCFIYVNEKKYKNKLILEFGNYIELYKYNIKGGLKQIINDIIKIKQKEYGNKTIGVKYLVNLQNGYINKSYFEIFGIINRYISPVTYDIFDKGKRYNKSTKGYEDKKQNIKIYNSGYIVYKLNTPN